VWADDQFLELTFYLLGVPIGYGRVKTLLDDSVRNCPGDFTAFKPVSVARWPIRLMLNRTDIDRGCTRDIRNDQV